MAIQWHPLFAKLLRPLVEEYYDVQTNFPVGDVPREADIVLLRRTTKKTLPFRGLWRHLTTWNILEYKGPTVSARLEDLDLLVELGLGIHRRLNEEGAKRKQKPMEAAQVSFWYLANSLGSRFRGAAETKLGTLEPVGDGIWRGRVLDRPVVLISGRDLPVEPESVPCHILGIESPEKELALAQLVVQQPSLWEQYGQYIRSFHPQSFQEVQAMARTAKKKEFKIHIKPLIELMGMEEFIKQAGKDEVFAGLCSDPKEKKRFLAKLLKDFSEKEIAELKRNLE
jgi:hypothetical protein